MDITSSPDFSTRFAPIIAAHRTGAFLAGSTLEALVLHSGGALSVAWAPFDYVPVTARLVVVGITPGRQQAENALGAFREALAAGALPAEASRRAKFTGAFSGPMRENLGRVDKARKGDSRDAAGHDSTLIFMQEISVDPRASDGRAVGVLRTFRH